MIIHWRLVLFTDESCFSFFRSNDRRHINPRRGECFCDSFVERDKFGEGSIRVMGGISHGVKSKLIVVRGNLTAVR